MGWASEQPALGARRVIPDEAKRNPGRVSMVRYRRNFVPGGTFFFTLADRRSSVLVEHVQLLRSAFRDVRERTPFSVDAVVVLPDHLHTILTLPSEDSDFSGPWKAVKSKFTRGVVASGVAVPRNERGEYLLWQRGFGSIQYATNRTSNVARTMSFQSRQASIGIITR
jgi:REP element-mobilizing transposase RayT